MGSALAPGSFVTARMASLSIRSAFKVSIDIIPHFQAEGLGESVWMMHADFYYKMRRVNPPNRTELELGPNGAIAR